MSGTGGFQTQAYPQPAMAVAGDFASQNPYWSFDAGPGGLVAGVGGVTIGVFAWAKYPPDADGAPSQVFNSAITIQPTSAYGTALVPPSGFVHRAQQALITAYLGYYTQVIPQGFPVTLMTGGDFWCVNNGTTDALVGQKAFASVVNGQVSFAASGTVGGLAAIGTSAVITSQQFTVTGSITGDILTVTANGSGGVYPGATITSNGVGVVVAVLSGTPTGTGTFLLSMNEQAVAQTTAIVGGYGQLTVGGQPSTTVPVAVGDIVFGSGVVTGPPTVVMWSISGSGTVTQTMIVNNNTAVATTTMSFATAIETRFWAVSTGLPGELVKITDKPVY